MLNHAVPLDTLFSLTKTALNNSLDVNVLPALQRRNDHRALAVSKRKHRKFVFEARVQRCNNKVPPAITFLKV